MARTLVSVKAPWSTTLTVDETDFPLNSLDSKPLGIEDDALARSCAVYRRYMSGEATRWFDLGFATADPEDIEQANAIRKYYNGKLAFKTLKGQDLTKFQADLLRFCTLQEPTRGDLGMIYRVPYFYAEDQQREKLLEMFPWGLPAPRQNMVTELAEHELTPVMHIFRSRSRFEANEYWFRDENNHPVKLEVRTSEPFSSLIQGLFEQPKIQVRAHYHRSKSNVSPGLRYWIMSQMQLVM